ncbi:hypothetical protein TeGR_g1365 [Tetraparma gracilis]|uniref:Peptidase S54 rhomboid domain-containing protein n=1 Tax=Tetraparma gracilis TaxID=2962635 RepID=A0ABQ6N8I8_9STRA|nr:hypothetical protein TeGR_g1365 [Tetraparma gracilis]
MKHSPILLILALPLLSTSFVAPPPALPLRTSSPFTAPPPLIPPPSFSTSLSAKPIVNPASLPPPQTALPLAILVGYAWQVVWSLKDFVAIKQAFGSAFPVSYPSHLVAAATGLTGSRFVFRSVTHRPIMYDPSGSLSRALSFVPRRAAAEPYRFLSNALLHGDLFHLYFNLSFLRSVIPSLQSLQTPTDLLYSTFLISVIAGNVACFFTYGARSLTPCVGASGGIFGLLGLLLVASRRARATNLSQNVMRTAALNFAYGLMSPGISNAAHAGGFAAGIAVGYLGGGKMKKGYQSKRSPYGGGVYLESARGKVDPVLLLGGVVSAVLLLLRRV